MKLYLMAYSFYPLLFLFFVGIYFRIHTLASVILFCLICWTMLVPFIIVFYGTVVIPEKKENAKQKDSKQKDSKRKDSKQEDSKQEDSKQKEGGANVVHQQE